jgi:hypothetical protein
MECQKPEPPVDRPLSRSPLGSKCLPKSRVRLRIAPSGLVAKNRLGAQRRPVVSNVPTSILWAAKPKRAAAACGLTESKHE